jgi:hypothetical protein
MVAVGEGKGVKVEDGAGVIVGVRVVGIVEEMARGSVG